MLSAITYEVVMFARDGTATTGVLPPGELAAPLTPRRAERVFDPHFRIVRHAAAVGVNATPIERRGAGTSRC